MILNLPKAFPLDTLAKFSFGAPDGREDELLKSHLCLCQIEPVREVVKGNKSVIVGERGTGKTALFRLLSEGTLKFEYPADLRQVLVPVEEELDFKTFRNTIIARIKEQVGDESLKYRIVWEVFLIHRLLTSVDERLKLPPELTSKLKQINELFDLKQKKPKLIELLLHNKKTVGVKVDSHMPNMPMSYYASIEPSAALGESSPVQSAEAILNIDKTKSDLNKFLADNNTVAVVLIDRLDEFVIQDAYEIQKMVLQGLLDTEKSFSPLKNLRVKVFIRADLFRQLDFEKIGFDKLVHRKVELKWSHEDIREFVARRISFNYATVLKLNFLVFLREGKHICIDFTGDQAKKAKPLIRLFSGSKKSSKDEWDAVPESFTDDKNRQIIKSLFPKELNHKTIDGSEERISTCNFLETHFCLHKDVITPRTILNYLEKALAKAVAYFRQQPQEKVILTKENEYPLFKREVLSAAYRELKDEMWVSLQEHSGQWSDWVAMLRKKKKNDVMSYKQIRRFLNAEDESRLKNFLSYLTHNGVLVCQNSSVTRENRNFFLPILYKEV
ncbi:MAG TPA: hypothetical protein PKA41_09690 [Verrucomicrobiota bacterium]|nr:hypothetical protein [Verrucomicrobiota bacterium]